MQAINDFTRSLTNHHVLRLNIYKAGTLYLANNAFRNTVSVLYMEACLHTTYVALIFLHWPRYVQKNLTCMSHAVTQKSGQPLAWQKKEKRAKHL